MTSIANRLEKLENDLNLLTAMQHLIVSNDSDLIGDEDFQFPTRDTINNVKKLLPPKCRPINKKKPPPVPERTPRFKSQCSNEDGSNINDLIKKNQDLETKLEKLETQLMNAEKNGLDIEEIKIELSSNLEKITNELERERDCKNGLLRITMQMKNQLLDKENKISDLGEQVENFKKDQLKFIDEIQTLKFKNEKSEQAFQILQQKEKDLIRENENLNTALAKIEIEKNEEHRANELKEMGITKQEQKFLNQQSQLVVKCAQLDQMRESALNENKELKTKLVEKESEIQKLIVSRSKSEAELERSNVLHECALNKVKSDLETQTIRLNQKIASCHHVMSQTKEVFRKLNSDKQELQQSLTLEKESNKILNENVQSHTKKLEEIEKFYSNDSQGFKAAINEKEEAFKKLKHKAHEIQKLNIKLKLKIGELEKRLMEEREKSLNQVKHFDELKSCLESENLRFKHESKNVSDNFSILQKISEDQIKTIQKLKYEAEEFRKLESSLRNQLRSLEDTSEISNRKLATAERRMLELEDEIEYLRHKLTGLEDDLKKHNCEDFVESTCKKKLNDLEISIKNKEKEWDRCREKICAERDKAITASKRALSKALGVKTESQTKIMELENEANQATLRVNAEKKKEVTQKNTQIQNLETELEKVRGESIKIQQMLSQKIHQLQSALNICFGSFPSQSQVQPLPTFNVNPAPPPPPHGFGSVGGFNFGSSMNF